MKTFVGIDPGKSGAVCIIQSDGYYAVHDMPVFADGKIDAYRLSVLIPNSPDTIVFLEKAQPMPKQGVVSIFTYGEGYGKIKGMLETLLIQYREVSPRVWKKEFGLSRDKEQSVAAAQRLFPLELFVTSRGRLLHGKAEAALIAEYCRRKYALLGDN